MLLEALLRLTLAASLALPFLLPARRCRSPRRARAWLLTMALAFVAGLLVDPLALGRLRVDESLVMRAACAY
jgi:phosphatidylserine synthase